MGRGTHNTQLCQIHIHVTLTLMVNIDLVLWWTISQGKCNFWERVGERGTVWRGSMEVIGYIIIWHPVRLFTSLGVEVWVVEILFPIFSTTIDYGECFVHSRNNVDMQGVGTCMSLGLRFTSGDCYGTLNSLEQAINYGVYVTSGNCSILST